MSAIFFIREEYKPFINAIHEAKGEKVKLIKERIISNIFQFDDLYDYCVKMFESNSCFVVHNHYIVSENGSDERHIFDVGLRESNFVKSLGLNCFDYVKNNDELGVINLSQIRNSLRRIKTMSFPEMYKDESYDDFKKKLIQFLEKAINLKKPIYFYID